ncbi:21395_t:CDS:2, partial [Gigaspora margarita]
VKEPLFLKKNYEKAKNSYMVEKKQKAVELARCTSNLYTANYYSLDLTMLAHIIDPIKAALHLENTDLAIIPRGLTKDISEDVIICAFKKYSISNCLSGSEDHLIYDDNDENNFNENSDNNEYKR